MIEQLTLAPVRNTDPDTSRAAAASLPLRDEQRLVLDVLSRGPATAHELVTRLANDGVVRAQNCVASRLSELGRLGLARQTEDRRPGPTGRTQVVWEAV